MSEKHVSNDTLLWNSKNANLDLIFCLFFFLIIYKWLIEIDYFKVIFFIIR